ncbi:MAG: 4Fe-4S dicluster domain-containing protein [Dehalococcoidales bacterium]|nr:4Fe-4S dicluster domain-containing protein [Dehalococcoidales bacterium]
MSNTDTIYTELQKHLDKQAVGFPATKSGVEISILKELFTPEQASLAIHLSFEPRTVNEIHANVHDNSLSPERVERLLRKMVINGAIGVVEKDDDNCYYLMPLLIGVVEWHGGRATSQFWVDFSKYLAEGYGKAYATTKVSQMRTIPVQKSLSAEHKVTTYDQVRDIIANTDGPISIAQCMCREGAKSRGEPCKVTSRTETCMSFGDWAHHFMKLGAKEISKEEALEIIRQNEEDGLVLQPTNYQKLDFICSCCGCCCGVLKIQKMLPNPAAFWAHNFYAEVDMELCTACGICAEKCQVDAATIDEQNGYATINLDRCIGCGNCVANCPSEAMQMKKVEVETAPPEERTDLYRILAEKG